ncbi:MULTISPECIES: hypothetical protein [unclassified Rhizobium]|nr:MULTISPECIES: hypothetical protein [unclassified Rhizobium]
MSAVVEERLLAKGMVADWVLHHAPGNHRRGPLSSLWDSLFPDGRQPK